MKRTLTMPICLINKLEMIGNLRDFAVYAQNSSRSHRDFRFGYAPDMNFFISAVGATERTQEAVDAYYTYRYNRGPLSRNVVKLNLDNIINNPDKPILKKYRK